MNRRFRRRLGALLIACLVSLCFAAVPSVFAAPVDSRASAPPFGFAVIGDTPYGPAQLAKLPGRIRQINMDTSVGLVAHVGDIGSPVNCSEAYYRKVLGLFNTFADPMMYTPGDNEWTDCHRASVGAGNPLARLAKLRSVFFSHPGTTLGVAKTTDKAQSGYPENVSLDRGGLTFATAHIVGSHDGLDPWTGLGHSTPTAAQRVEVSARATADINHIRAAFSRATAGGSRAVVLFTQADMFAATGSATRSAYQSLVRAIAEESAAFRKPVFLFNGDSHVFRSDKPLSSATWLSFYGISAAVPNLTRYTVEGGSSLDEWVKVSVVAGPAVLSVQRVSFS